MFLPATYVGIMADWEITVFSFYLVLVRGLQWSQETLTGTNYKDYCSKKIPNLISYLAKTMLRSVPHI